MTSDAVNSGSQISRKTSNAQATTPFSRPGFAKTGGAPSWPSGLPSTSILI